MAREHKVTHPILGIATWGDIEKARPAGGCSWCHGPVGFGRRTRCGSEECSERIWQAYSWPHVARVVIRRDKAVCVTCGKQRCDLQVDHIVPVMLGGTGDISNLRSLCLSCHKEETARLRKLKDAFVAHIALSQPFGPSPVVRFFRATQILAEQLNG